MSKGIKDLSQFFRTGSSDKDVLHIPSGIIGLDYAIGEVRGIPTRTIMEIIAKEKRGKSTLSLGYIANAQRLGIRDVEVPVGKTFQTFNAAYIDFERTFDKNYARLLGVDVDKLLIVETKYAEQGFDAVESLLAMGMQIIVVDSVPAAVPQSEEGKNITDSEKMAAIAGLLSRAMRRLIALTDNANALVIMINQWRANMSPMSRSDKKPYGAFALHHYSRVILHLERIRNGDDDATITAFVDKTKFGKERQTAEFELIFGAGFDADQHILTLAADNDIVEKGGAWYYYPNKEAAQYKAQGMAQARSIMPIDEIKEKLLTALILKQDQERAERESYIRGNK